MSSKDDIIDGSQATGRKYGLIYTNKAGWIDLGHANPEGASQLWQMVECGKSNLSTIVNKAFDDLNPLVLGQALVTSINNIKARIKMGDYYIVEYGQSMSRKIVGPLKVTSGKKKYFIIKKDLSATEKQSVALAIFMKVSHAFEKMQGSFPFFLVTDSGYSVEDLMSNLLGFYRAIYPTRNENYVHLCEPTSKTEALYVWDNYGPVGSSKNKDFRPYLYPTSSTSTVRPGVVALPYFLNTISPASEEKLFFEI